MDDKWINHEDAICIAGKKIISMNEVAETCRSQSPGKLLLHDLGNDCLYGGLIILLSVHGVKNF